MKMDISQNFKITKKLGSGAFGEIFHAVNCQTEEEFALKVEPLDSKNPQLVYEAKLYEHFFDYNSGNATTTTKIIEGIPRFYRCIKEGASNIMVMELLGQNLQELMNACGGKFSVKTVLMLGEQMIRRIEFLHSKNVLHRDIKPENFLIGLEKNQNIVYLIDFGLAKRFVYKNGNHMKYKEKRPFIGTARYASINTHLGIEQGRRDDIESICYVLIYLLKGRLPWQNLQAHTKKERYAKILEIKQNTSIHELCQGLPSEFETMLSYVKNLKYEDRPDYAYLKNLLQDLYNRLGFEDDNVYDWTLPLQIDKEDEEMQK